MMLTDSEWQTVLDALVKGGLRETIDSILLSRQGSTAQ